MKKTIVNQQEFLEQLQRNKLAKNAMITGIPKLLLSIITVSMNPKVKAMNEFNLNLRDQHYSIRGVRKFTYP